MDVSDQVSLEIAELWMLLWCRSTPSSSGSSNWLWVCRRVVTGDRLAVRLRQVRGSGFAVEAYMGSGMKYMRMMLDQMNAHSVCFASFGYIALRSLHHAPQQHRFNETDS
jgi:hypothetical protein